MDNIWEERKKASKQPGYIYTKGSPLFRTSMVAKVHAYLPDSISQSVSQSISQSCVST